MTAAKPLGDQKPKKKPLIIKNLIFLKLVLFLFYGGLGCIFFFLPLHMIGKGLNREEAQLISVIAPFVSIIGPLIVGPLCDKLAAKKTATGFHLRLIGTITILLSALFYSLLLVVPYLGRFNNESPQVAFGCDADGAILFQQRIKHQPSCHSWEKPKIGDFILTNCSYTCHEPDNFEKMYKPWASPYVSTESSNESDDYDDAANYTDVVENKSTEKNKIKQKSEESILPPRVPYPHLCIKSSENKPSLCHAFTESNQHIILNGALGAAINAENKTHKADWCKYPLGMKKNVFKTVVLAFNHIFRWNPM